MKKNTTSTTPISRPPVVVVLGHVDHGKTTLLDTIRKTDVAAREHGGITQKIGAYQVTLPDSSKITFIDTPGHEAFSKMRSSGVSVADVAILVVAANDSVMPQTVESIKIIQAAKIPFIVAVNKVDLPDANVDKVVQDLLRHNVLLEGFGGDVPMIKVSGKREDGIKELLDLIKLVADVHGLSGSDEGALEAVIIESKLDKGRGVVATAIIRNGVLHVGDDVFVEDKEVKIRSLVDYLGQQLKEAGAGTPVEILGLSQVPKVGVKILSQVGQAAVVAAKQTGKTATGEDSEVENTLSLILRADTVGSLDAILAKLPANVNLIKSETGDVSDADVLLAKSTGAIILGFNVKAGAGPTKLAETEKVLLRTYRIIYELLDELTDAAAGMLETVDKEEIMGVGQVLAEFPFEKLKIAGVRVTDGRMARGDLVRITRGDEVVGEGKVKSLRIGRDESNKAEKGKDCGLLIDPQVDFRPGDGIISYRII